MIKRMQHLVSRHQSLMLLAALSACYFASMIIARKSLSPDDLYFWNSLITLIAMAFTFCFFGAEQLFLRFSTVAEGKVSINKNTLRLMGAGLALFSVVLTILSEAYFFRLDSIATYVVLCVCVAMFVFVYNFLRILKAFNTSQLAANGWKLIVLGALCLAPFGDAPLIIMAALVVSGAVAAVLLWRSRHRLVVTSQAMPDDWKTLFAGFFLSLLALMLLNNADRLIMTRYATPELFSEYVYLVTLLLMPFSLLSNYFGFKEMAFLKESYQRQAFLRKIEFIAAVSAGLFVPWFGLIYALQEVLDVPVKLAYFLPCFVIVTCRCSYALLSTLFGLKGAPRHIHIANFLTLVLVAGAVLTVLGMGVDVTKVLYLLVVFWCMRVLIFFYFTSKISQDRATHAI